MDVNPQPGLLRQIEQRRQRARRVGAGIEAGTEQVGAHPDRVLQSVDRRGLAKIVSRGRERDDVDVEPVGHLPLCRQDALHRPQLDDGVDVGVRAHAGHPVAERPLEQARGPRLHVAGGERRARRGRRRQRIRERARAKRLHGVGAIGMGVQIHQARQRKPSRFAGLLDRTNGRDRSVAQRHAEHAAAARQGDESIVTSFGIGGRSGFAAAAAPHPGAQ